MFLAVCNSLGGAVAFEKLLSYRTVQVLIDGLSHHLFVLTPVLDAKGIKEHSWFYWGYSSQENSSYRTLSPACGTVHSGTQGLR